VAWIDFDHDGLLDLYRANGPVNRSMETAEVLTDPYSEENQLFRGTPGGRLELVTPSGGTRTPLVHGSRGAIFGDVDNDGAMDIIVANRDASPYLLMNVAPRRGNWIMLRVLDEHGRDAYGARVAFQLGERKIVREIMTAYSFAAANDPRVHVGLGAHKSIEDMVVRWIDGTHESFGGFRANQIHMLRRGEGEGIEAELTTN